MANERLGAERRLVAVRSDGPRPLVGRISVAVFLLCLYSFFGVQTSVGQQRPAVDPTQVTSPDLGQADSVFAPADRGVIVLLDRTRQLLDENRYAEAVQCLDKILSGTEDFFFRPDADTRVHRSIKSEARRMLGEIPPSARQSYELQFGAFAQSTLDDAVETGSIEKVAEVARRFFHTTAGYEATFLLGMHHMDHGRPLVAALTLQRLQEESPQSDRFEPSLSLATARSWLAAGMPENARATLDRLRSRFPNQALTIEGRKVPLFKGTDDSVKWLSASLGPNVVAPSMQRTDWTVHGGSPQRITVSKGSRPLFNPRWIALTTDDPEVEAMIESIRRQQEDREATLLPGLYPLVVDGVVLMRTATNLLAVDFETGKRLWEVPADDPFNPSPDSQAIPMSSLESDLRLRLWGDGTFGTLSSDGKRVFSVEDLQLRLPIGYPRVLVPGNRRWTTNSLMTTNRLAAFDLRSQGKLQWELGGAKSENPLRLAGAFFLGPPLPLLGDLFVLAEIDGEVRLLALDAETGDLLWQQQLAIVADSIYQDTLRRVSGVSPSYADGILICPTSNRSIVAIELTTRSLLWGYSYADRETSDERHAMFLGSTRHRTANPEDRWCDSSVVIADGKVLATPVDSEELHCLSLKDGKLLWRLPREDKLYVAAVAGGKVVVATRKGLIAVNLEDGKPAWDPPLAACPSKSEPSGCGFTDGNAYYLPLTGGKLMKVGLEMGSVEHVFQSRNRHDLGNLVCHDGRIISQRCDRLESYYQIEALRKEVDERLAARPDDARALTLRGELLWEERKLDEAIDALHRSIQLGDSLHARAILREVMFDGLVSEFARYEKSHREIEELLDTFDDRVRYHRLMADGWENAAQYNRALAEYRKLVDLDFNENAFVAMEDDYSVRLDRWIQGRLVDLFEEAPDDVRAELVRWSGETLQQGRAMAGPVQIGRALEYFGGLPNAREFRDEWIERLIAADRIGEAELALMGDVKNGQRDRLAGSLLRWTSMLMEAGRPADVRSLLQEIGVRWSDVTFEGGRSGKAWAQQFAANHEEIPQHRVPGDWPRGLVKTSVLEPEQSELLPSYAGASVPFLAGKGIFCKDWTIEQRQQNLVAKDSFGQVLWQIPLTQLADPGQLAAGRNLMRVEDCGHLLIVSLGNRIVALDTLATTEDGAPAIAWSESVEGVDAAQLQRQLFQARVRNASFLGSSGFSPRMALVLGESLICVKRSRVCAAIDPATGQSLWERGGVSTQSEIFGDDEYVLVVPRQSAQARVFRAKDGAELEPRMLPPEEYRLATIGRRILCWEKVGNEYELKLIDPMKPHQEGCVWGPYKFPINAQKTFVDHELIAVFTPDGKFRLIDSKDGKSLIDTNLGAEKPLSEPLTDVVVFRREDQYLLVANSATSSRNARRRVNQLMGGPARRIGAAKVMAFDLDGKPMWENPTTVENHVLPLTQPPGAPCLTFACTVQETVAGRPPRTMVEVLCIDTRSGAVIADQEFAQTSRALEIAADPDRSRVEVRMSQETLALQFTDEPIPEGGMLQPQETPTASNSVEAVMRAVLGGVIPDGLIPHQEAPLFSIQGCEGVVEPEKAAPAQKAPSGKDESGPVKRTVPPPPLEPAIRGQIAPANAVPSE